MRKEISSFMGDETTSDPSYAMADSSTMVSDNRSSQEQHALKTAKGGDEPAPAESHPPSGYTSLPYPSHSIMDRSKIDFGSEFEPDADATNNMIVLGKSTDGSLRLYQSSYRNGAGIDETSQAQQGWDQKKACSDDLDAILDVFGKNTEPLKHAGLAEQVQRRGLWAGP